MPYLLKILQSNQFIVFHSNFQLKLYHVRKVRIPQSYNIITYSSNKRKTVFFQLITLISKLFKCNIYFINQSTISNF